MTTFLNLRYFTTETLESAAAILDRPDERFARIDQLKNAHRAKLIISKELANRKVASE